MILPILVANIWQVARSGQFRQTARRYWLLAAVLVVCLWASSQLATAVSGAMLTLIIGVVILLFALLNLTVRVPPIPARYDRVSQLAAGVAAGSMGGLTAIWAPPIVIYLLASRAEKDDFVRAAGFLFLLGSLPLCLGYWQNGLLGGAMALASASMVIPTILGFTLGEWLRRRLDPARFRRAVLLLFLLLGLNLIRRSLF